MARTRVGKIRMATITNYIDAYIASKQEEIKRATEAKALVALLPEELRTLNGEVILLNTNPKKLQLTFWQFENPDVDLRKRCKTIGIQGMKESFTGGDFWYCDGDFVLIEGTPVHCCLYCLPTPPACHVEAYQETVTKYRAICNETGEEVK